MKNIEKYCQELASKTEDVSKSLCMENEEEYIQTAINKIKDTFTGTLKQINIEISKTKKEAIKEYSSKKVKFNKEMLQAENEFIRYIHDTWTEADVPLEQCWQAFYTAKYLILAGIKINDDMIAEDRCNYIHYERGDIERTCYANINSFFPEISDADINDFERNFEYAGNECYCYPIVVCMLTILQGMTLPPDETMSINETEI